MDFPNSYFEDEIRDGFYIPSLMKRVWAAQLEVLDGIQKVCKKHNIQYFAEWGSLLGAVRHGGMIPWDDDLDICMKGKDFEKFLTVIDELPEGSFFLDYHHSDDIDNMVCRIQNSKNLFLEPEAMIRYHGYPYTVGIDIFRLDCLPPDKKNEEEFRTVIEFVCAVIGMLIDAKETGESVNSEKMESMYERVEKLCHVKLDRNEPLKMQLYDVLYNKISHLYSETEAKEITDLAMWSGNSNYRMPKECFSDGILVPFENTEIMVPVGYEQLLRMKYGGNYMTPVRTGGAHEYPFYEAQQKKSKENVGIEFFQYRFSKEDIENVQREKKECLQQRVREFLPLFQEAHENILLYIQKGDINSASEILRECQNVAIQIGTMIEKERGEGNATVTTLEKYCEDLFMIHSLLIEGDASCYETARTKMRKFEEKLFLQIEQELQERKEIVFLPYKVSYWETMESVWKEAMEDPDSDVYVIPIPYYYKDVFGEVMEEEIYELDYPENVKLTSYKEYNFQVHHPDVIVMQYPYDEYNFALSIRPFFYGRNLKKYTDQLVYIPPLIMDEIGPEDVCARKTLKSFCNMPGVVHADKVIVQSEQMKKVYVEMLTEFAGEDTKNMWEDKIYGVGSPVYTTDKESEPLPDEWKSVLYRPDGSRKKVILYSTSASAILCHGENILEKMQDVFRQFQSCQDDVALIWRPDFNMRRMLRKEHPGLWRKCQDLVQKYRDDGWGIYDDSPNMERAVANCDAGYGDGGVVLNFCRNQKKPVMTQSV